MLEKNDVESISPSHQQETDKISTTMIQATRLTLLPNNDIIQNSTPSVSNNLSSTLSKNQQKKLKKKQEWESHREDRKVLRRQKHAEKKERLKAEKRAKYEAQKATACEPSKDARAVLISNQSQESLETLKHNFAPEQSIKRRNIRPRRANIRCIIDCSFDDLMIEKEVVSLASQLTRCYADNKKARTRVHLEFASINKRLLERLNFTHSGRLQNWKHIKISDQEYTIEPHINDAGNVVYLTSDSEYTLDTLQEGKTYIIGGIVDRNRHKGICYNKAITQGLQTARLPIDEYIKMASRVVLTTNQVFEIMLEWLQCHDWEHAFLAVIPTRKNPSVKKEDEQEDEGEGECLHEELEATQGTLSDNHSK